MGNSYRGTFGRGPVLSPLFAGLLFISWAWGGVSLHAAQSQERPILLRWACVAMSGEGSESKREKISQRAVLKTGDQIKMFLESKKKVFAYVIYQNAKGEMRLLFPYRFYGPESEMNPNQPYYIPGGDAWLAMENGTGEERIFLVASTKRLNRLEELIGDYGDTDPGKKADRAREVMSELQSLRQKHRDLSASAERPITMAGRVRGIQDLKETMRPDVAAFADEISAGDFYSKTITIERK